MKQPKDITGQKTTKPQERPVIYKQPSQLSLVEKGPSANLDGPPGGRIILGAVIPEGAVGDDLGGDGVERGEDESLIGLHVAGVEVLVARVVLEDGVMGLLAADGDTGVVGGEDLGQVGLVVPVLAVLDVDQEKRPAVDGLADAAPHIDLREPRVRLHHALGLLGAQHVPQRRGARDRVPVAVRDGERADADVLGREAAWLDALVAQAEDVGDDDGGAGGLLHQVLALLEVGALEQLLVFLAVEEVVGRHGRVVVHELVAGLGELRLRRPDVLHLALHLHRRVDVGVARREVDVRLLLVLGAVPHAAHAGRGTADDHICCCHFAGGGGRRGFLLGEVGTDEVVEIANNAGHYSVSNGCW